jgi:hypothetical protein
MKNQTQLLLQPDAVVFADKAIKKIKNRAKKFYPKLDSSTRLSIILECLIEVIEEKRYIAAQ